jgi:PASTA domain/FG-GAP-like repeat
VAAVLMAGLVSVAGGAPPAWAATSVPQLSVAYLPADVALSPPAQLISIQLTLQQGETRRLIGQLDARSPTSVGATEMASNVQCVKAGDPVDPPDEHSAIGYHGVAAKNYVGSGDTFLTPMTLFTAPATGTYTCVLSAYTQDPGISARASLTFLEWDSSDVSPAGYFNAKPCGSNGNWSTCTYLSPPGFQPPGTDSQAYVLDPGGIDPAQGWTPALDATTVDAEGTLGLTTCHKSRSCVSPYVDDRPGGATVVTRMEVIQRNPFGGLCAITKTADRTDTISASVHHYGIPYTLDDVPVQPICGSRVFSARIFVQVISGDNVKIDGTVPYDHDGGLPLPTFTGETRTHVMLVNSATPVTPVPDVGGLSKNDAAAALSAAGLSVGTLSEVMSASLSGTVVAQNPSPGRVAVRGSGINLAISAGPVSVGPPWEIVGSADMDGNGKADIVWYNTRTGETQIWYINGASNITARADVTDETGKPIAVGPPWEIVGSADMDGNGRADIVWHNASTGETQVWYMNGASRIASRGTVVDENGAFIPVGPPWAVVAAADMDGNGRADIVWHNAVTGETQVWYMNGASRIASRGTVVDENGAFIPVGPPWAVVAAADMDGNGKADIIWHNASTGVTQIWYMNGSKISQRASVTGSSL